MAKVFFLISRFFIIRGPKLLKFIIRKKVENFIKLIFTTALILSLFLSIS